MEKLWDKLISLNIATENELLLVTCINGYTKETLFLVLDARTGFKNIEQYEDAEG